MGQWVAKRKEGNKGLSHSEIKYRRLFEESPEGVFIVTPDRRIVDVNEAGLEVLGYNREELLKMHPGSLHANPEEKERIWERLNEQEVVKNENVHLRRKDGKKIVCEVSAAARRKSNGEIGIYQFFLRDVTERHQVQKALRESEEKFRRLAEKSLVGIGVVQDRVFTYVNPALAKIVGYTPDELTGKSPDVFVHPDDVALMHEQMQKRLEGKVSTVKYQVRAKTKEGEFRMIEVHGGRISYAGRPAVIGTLVDITKRVRLQQEILQIQEAERQRIGQDLHDSVSSSISGLSMVLGSLKKRAEQECEDLAEDLAEVRLLLQEASQDVRRISRGLSPVIVEKAGLKTALERLAVNTTTSSGATCRFEVEADTSTIPNDVATHLYWIAQEAATNARKYAEAQQIVIRLKQDGSELLLQVTDDGQGFDPSQKENEGLGLRTMQYRAELLGASLTIDSQVGQGTTIECRLSL